MKIESKLRNLTALPTGTECWEKTMYRALSSLHNDGIIFNPDELDPFTRKRMIEEVSKAGGDENSANLLLAILPELSRRGDVAGTLFAESETFYYWSSVFAHKDGHPPGLSYSLEFPSDHPSPFTVEVSAIILHDQHGFSEEMLAHLIETSPKTVGRLNPGGTVTQETLDQHAAFLREADDPHQRFVVTYAGEPVRSYQAIETYHLIDGCLVQITVRIYYKAGTVGIVADGLDNVEPLC